MSDTPETDAEHARMQMGGFTMDFCRKLERDEAREQVKNLEDQRDLCMKTICRLEKELDQIRAVFGHGANDADWKPGTTIAEAVEKVMRERNEARKLACLYKDQFYAVSMPTVKPPKFSYEEGYIQ